MKQFLLGILLLVYGICSIAYHAAAKSSTDSIYLADKTSMILKTWPNLNVEYLQTNLNYNIHQSLYVNQGSSTNFCGYAAITYYLVKHQPENYVRMVQELAIQGYTYSLSGKKLTASNQIKKYAGTLKNKGIMDINHADQIWYLTLADNYKGYLNWIYPMYKKGYENNFWASTNYAKFNHMLASLTDLPISARGTDLIRPSIPHIDSFLNKLLASNTVFLYLNNKKLSPTTFANLVLPIPTHFIELYGISAIGDYYIIEYWDYGFRTKVQVDQKLFKKVIYGITTIKK